MDLNTDSLFKHKFFAFINPMDRRHRPLSSSQENFWWLYWKRNSANNNRLHSGTPERKKAACGIEKKIVREENEIEKNENESEDGVVEHSKVQVLESCQKFWA